MKILEWSWALYMKKHGGLKLKDLCGERAIPSNDRVEKSFDCENFAIRPLDRGIQEVENLGNKS